MQRRREDESGEARSQETVDWAGFSLPERTADGHFLVVGSIGSGKTRMHRELMASVLPKVRAGRDVRALIYDAKLDVLAELQHLCPGTEVNVLNPGDRRSLIWDVAKDVSESCEARTFASIIIPGGREPSFFVEAARHLCAGVVQELNRRVPKQWTLRDLFWIATVPQRLRQFLGGTDQYETFCDPPVTFHNICATLASTLYPLKRIAALWHHSPGRLFSVKEWTKSGSSVLVLSGTPHDAGQRKVNEAILDCVGRLVPGYAECSEGSRLWLFCDELVQACTAETLNRFLCARSKGVRCVLGCQDLEELTALYGSGEVVRRVVTQCCNISWLRLTNVATADWASHWATEKGVEFDDAALSSPKKKDGTVILEHVRHQEVLAAEFFSLPLSEKGKVTGFHMFKGIGGVVKSEAQCPVPPVDMSRNFLPTDESGIDLPPWTREDDERLGMHQSKDG